MNKPFFEHPWERRGIVSPGLPLLPHGVERHPVPGGGSRVVPIYAGDEVSVLDKDGLQPGELVMFGPDRVSDAARLGRRGHGRPYATIATLANGSASGAQVLKALATAGFEIESGDGIAVFSEGSRPGDTETMTVQADGLLICAAPGGPMTPEAQNAPTELVLY
ncbi:MAG: aminomethyltransferase, partial [Pseudomonadota bacterium]